MLTEYSAGAIIFHKKKGEINYLLLHYPRGSRLKKDYWDLPKGHLEEKEKPQETAIREVTEETGLKDIIFFDGFKEKIKYSFQRQRKKVLKFVVFYLAETKNDKIKLSQEHIDYKWLPQRAALELLTFKNAKQILKKAHELLSVKDKTV